jgi:hypothetical protein
MLYLLTMLTSEKLISIPDREKTKFYVILCSVEQNGVHLVSYENFSHVNLPASLYYF